MQKKQLKNIYSVLASNSEESIQVINVAIQNLEELLLKKSFSVNEDAELLQFMEAEKMLPLLQKSYEIFETQLEISFAKKIENESTNSKEELKKYLLYKRFITLIQNEIQMANITQKDYLLFIGSGPIPITGILLHQLTGCKVDCCEKVSESAELSEKVINKLGYSNEIKIITAERSQVDYSKYSIILVALLAKPKSIILKEIWGSIKNGVRVICRTSDLSRQAFYETTEEQLFALYNPVHKNVAKGDQTISSVLLIKA